MLKNKNQNSYNVFKKKKKKEFGLYNSNEDIFGI